MSETPSLSIEITDGGHAFLLNGVDLAMSIAADSIHIGTTGDDEFSALAVTVTFVGFQLHVDEGVLLRARDGEIVKAADAIGTVISDDDAA